MEQVTWSKASWSAVNTGEDTENLVNFEIDSELEDDRKFLIEVVIINVKIRQ